MSELSTSSNFDPLTGKTLVILGLARQGKALARFAVGRGANVVVSDLRSAETLAKSVEQLSDLKIEYVFGSHPPSLLDNADFLAISGSVPADAPFVNAARERGVRITNDSQEFLRRSPAPTIGITGSAGKSTTTSLVGAMGKTTDRTTWIGGNLGFPLISHVGAMGANDIVVQELSSFQLEIWEQSPHIAAILNVTPNHLDRHKTMDVYTEAKANILRFQSAEDIAVLPTHHLDHLIPLVQGRLRQFGFNPVDDGAFVRDGQVVLRDGTSEQVICAVSDVRLRGKHNLLNVLAATTLADSAGISAEAIQTAIRTFTGIPHRLELVETIDAVQYINDSIATAPERAIAALNAFHEPLILLAGGRDKDLDWDDWATLVMERCKAVVLFGEIGRMVSGMLSSIPVHLVETLDEAVTVAANESSAGDVVLLSPGGTSFDAYTDFAERGEHFRQLVRGLTDG